MTRAAAQVMMAKDMVKHTATVARMVTLSSSRLMKGESISSPVTKIILLDLLLVTIIKTRSSRTKANTTTANIFIRISLIMIRTILVMEVKLSCRTN